MTLQQHSATWDPTTSYASCPCGWKANAAGPDGYGPSIAAEHNRHPIVKVQIMAEVEVVDSPTYHLALHKAVGDAYGSDLEPMPLPDLVALAMSRGVDLGDVARSVRCFDTWGPRFEAVGS